MRSSWPIRRRAPCSPAPRRLRITARAGSCGISEPAHDVSAAEILEAVSDYYSGRLREHGATPAGVDWSSAASQQLRFAQLLSLIDWRGAPSVLDFGCGYGALAQQLCREQREFTYVGFDLSPEMVRTARELTDDSRCSFTSERSALEQADYVLASGIFNVKLQTGEADWRRYVAETLDELASLSARGFSFNMLTRYADRPLMRDDLYYADPGGYFGLCKERYARDVALLHDYGLFEFTLLVRLGSAPKPLVDEP